MSKNEKALRICIQRVPSFKEDLFYTDSVNAGKEISTKNISCRRGETKNSW